MKIELKIISGPLKGKRLFFEDYQKIFVGRSSKALLSFPDDEKLSRIHCFIEILPPYNCFVEDLKSRNGTYIGHLNKEQKKVSFRKIAKQHLASGDFIKVGKSKFCLKWKANEKKEKCNACGSIIEIEQYAQGRASLCDGKVVCQMCQGTGEIAAGKKLGSFEIASKLGQGGMGIVYLVLHKDSEKQFAIKVARPRVKPNKNQIKKFLREANIGVKIKHKHIVRYFEAQYTEAGFFYIPMEYIQGINLKKYLNKLARPLKIDESKDLIFQLLDAVEYLHENSVIHRDIKPQNILLVEGNKHFIKLTDFGLAKNYQGAGLSGLTGSYEALGTPYFSAPEQFDNARDVDPRADIYSIGATLYYMFSLSTTHPQSNNHCFYNIFFEPPVPISHLNPDMPQEMVSIITKCLKKDVDKRVQTIAELRSLLQNVL